MRRSNYVIELLNIADAAIKKPLFSRIATPFAISLYNWNDATAVFYNGILQFISCCINVVNYIVISYTRIGRMYVECIIGCKN